MTSGTLLHCFQEGKTLRYVAHSQTSTITLARTYPGRPDQIQRVRADLRALLATCPVAEDAILCASELATNATSHSRSGQPGGRLAIHAKVCPGEFVQVEVRDQGGPWADAGNDGDRPHGLDIVRAVAGDGNWGIAGSDADGRAVWVRLGWTG
jgi:two-component sensor histidine kinase